MTIKYCPMCQRNVNASRKVGAGSIIAILFTGFIWLLVIPFYSKRCPICGNTHLKPINSTGAFTPAQKVGQQETKAPQNYGAQPKQSSIADEVEKLHSLKEKGVIDEHEFLEQKKKILS